MRRIDLKKDDLGSLYPVWNREFRHLQTSSDVLMLSLPLQKTFMNEFLHIRVLSSFEIRLALERDRQTKISECFTGINSVGDICHLAGEKGIQAEEVINTINYFFGIGVINFVSKISSAP